MKFGRAGFVVVALLVFSESYAQEICGRSVLWPDEELSDYLKDYASECTPREVEKFLDKHGIVDKHRIVENNEAQKREAGKGVQKENMKQMIGAWEEIAAAFEKLGKEAPDVSMGGQPSMRSTYKELFKRADTTKNDLKFAVETGAFRGNADMARQQVMCGKEGTSGGYCPPYYADTWHKPVKLNLLRSWGLDKNELKPLDIKGAVNAFCGDKASEICKTTLVQGRELILQWELADRISAIASNEVIRVISNQIAEKESLWNKYLYDSKPMFPPDIFATDLISKRWSYSDQFPEGFRSPPRTQWFFLHPSFGVEYASAAKDGDQMKPILYVEIIGANRWNEKERWLDLLGLRYFSGFSIIASYADRDGIKDTGYGGLFTFSNVYSIGVTRYGSDTGVFLSLDLANLFREKYKPDYEKYKNKLQELTQ